MNKVPFPQANSLRVLFILLLNIPNEEYECFNINSTINIIGMNKRQGGYYLDALRFLNLIEKVNSNVYILSAIGKEIVNSEIRIISYLKFYEVIITNVHIGKYYRWYSEFSNEKFKLNFIKDLEENFLLNNTTANRRFSAIKSWFLSIDKLKKMMKMELT